MDKLITAVIALGLVAFFLWLYQSDAGVSFVSQSQETMWVATANGQQMGSYSSYHDCVMAMKEAINVATTPYSCSLPS